MYRQWQRTFRWIVTASLLALWLIAVPVHAQVQLGENVNLTMNGQLGVGYGGDYGSSSAQSSHGTYFSGMGTLNGSYYNPRFLSFTAQPFYNRNQDNSAIGSVFSESGIDSSVNLFGGSHFPGSVSYGKALTNGSQYGIAGVPGLSADGSTQTFAVTWNAFVPKLPTLTATFSDTSSSNTILGEAGTTDTAIKGLNLISNYNLSGFQFYGYFNHQNLDATLPAFLTGSSLETESSNNTYGISVNHKLPLSGSFGVGYSRSTYSSDTNTAVNDGTAQTVDGGVSFNPTRRFTISANARYFDNLIGALQQSILPAGAVPINTYSVGSDGLTLNTFGTYNFGHNLVLIGYANRQIQHFEGTEYTNDQYGGTLTYSYARPLLGMLYLSVGTVNTAANADQGTLGFVGNLGFKKKFRGWDVNLDVSYNQSVQSSIALATTSNYNYGGFIRKRFGANTYWSASARNVQTGLTQQVGYANRSETFMTTLTHGKFGLSGSYSQSHGTSILTSSGVLVPTPLAPLLSPDQILYDGTAYGGGVSVTPLKRLYITANWFRANTSTTSVTAFSNNNNNRIYTQLQYNLRKLTLRATYWKVDQVIGGSTLPRTIQNSYSFTISRWFNLF